MAQLQNFRTAFNGFNREDVVHYLEYLNTRHQNQINQLTAEAEELRSRLANQPEDQQELIDQLKAQVEDLTQQLEQAKQAQAETPAASEPAVSSGNAELDTYRRAEHVEKTAREQAELIYHQANGVLAEATGKVEHISADITAVADRVAGQLTQLQMAVSSSKQVLQDAASLMRAIRPNQ